MSERTDLKLRHVRVAEYQYRHEAEFAAGFLDDAGIPYRLQIDDPGIGLAVGTPAQLWVRGMDLDRAGEILEVGNRIVAPTVRRRGSVPRRTAPSEGPPHGLTFRERGLSSVISAGLGWWAWQLAQAGVGEGPVRSVAIVAGLFAILAVAGKAPAIIKRLLAALSGGMT